MKLVFVHDVGKVPQRETSWRGMTIEPDNAFYILADEIEALGAATPSNLASITLSRAKNRKLPKGLYQIWLLNCANDAIELLEHHSMREDRLAENLKLIRDTQARLIDALAQASGPNFLASLGGGHIPNMIRLIGDSVSAINIDRANPIDRSNLKDKTEDLLKEVLQSTLEPYPKRALELKLIAFRRLLTDCDHYSDSEIRGRAKSIYADYCAEFEGHDKKHRTLAEAMLSWARLVSRPGIFALALTADFSAVAGLLTKQ